MYQGILQMVYIAISGLVEGYNQGLDGGRMDPSLEWFVSCYPEESQTFLCTSKLNPVAGCMAECWSCGVTMAGC